MIHNNKDHVLRAIKANVRFDGRKNHQYRDVKVEYGVSATAEGSAKVTIGDTMVIAGVKLSVGTPYADDPQSGTLVVDAQLLPLSSPLFESGPPDIDAIELARVIDRGIRESHAIDTSQLCIKSGEKVWVVSVDICTLNIDGNLFDAAALAALAALKDAKFPDLLDGYVINYQKKTDLPLPMVKDPIAITVWKVGGEFVVDPIGQEESVFDTRLTITTSENGSICSMQKGGEGTLTLSDVDAMIVIALENAAHLRKAL